MDNNINDKEIEKIIEAAKPRVLNDRANEARREKLKDVLRMQVLSELRRAGMAGIKEKLTVNEILMKNLRYAGAGVAVLALVVLAVFLATPKQNGGGIALLGSNAKVTRVGGKAFGNLTSLNAVTNGATGVNSAAGTNSAASTNSAAGTAPQSAGTKSATTDAALAPNAAISGSAIARPVSPNSMIRYPYPGPQTVKYVYKGNTFTQDQATMDVLKYVVTPISADQAVTALAQSNLGLNLNSFGGIALDNITLSENQDFGYTVDIDLLNGTLNLYQNYQKWPQENNPQSLTSSDIPADGAIIKIADQFLSDHSFAMGNYGSAEVVQNFNYPIPMMGAATKSAGPANPAVMRPYFPDTAEVLYPLVVNGKTVYDASGNKTGLTVQVNLRYNHVSNVSGVRTQNYQASSYDAITDVNKILALAENPPFYPINYAVPMMGAGASGGASGGGSAGSGSMTAPDATITKLPPNSFTTGNEIDFGTPTLGYVTMYNYANGQNDEFLVPAYIFPILNPSPNYYYGGNKNIVVPLIADFIQDQNSGKIVPLGASTPGASVPPSVAAPAPKPVSAPAPSAKQY